MVDNKKGKKLSETDTALFVVLSYIFSLMTMQLSDNIMKVSLWSEDLKELELLTVEISQ